MKKFKLGMRSTVTEWNENEVWLMMLWDEELEHVLSLDIGQVYTDYDGYHWMRIE